MKSYRPRPMGRRVNAGRVALVIGIIAAVIVAIILILNFAGKGNAANAQEQPTASVNGEATFGKDVSINGVQLAGKTAEEAKIALQPIANHMLNNGKVAFTVQEQNYSYPLEEAGVATDIDAKIKEALEYSNGMKIGEGAKDYTLEFTFDQNVLRSLIEGQAMSWTQQPTAGSYEVEISRSEENLTTGGKLVRTPAQDGYQVDTEDLITKLSEQIQNQTYEPVTAKIDTIPATEGTAQMPELEVIGKYTTEYTSKTASRKERMYNIWKISDIMNGSKIMPGETYSVNDTVGDRTVEKGWALAPGIENGEYKDQPGGGICQVSTTMYNAALRAEMKMVNRVPHTIPSSYVPLGMDATISTGGPDFKFENNTDYPVYVIIDCNVPDRKVTVNFYGYRPRDYTLKWESKVAEVVPKPAPVFIRNAALDPYAIVPVLEGREGKIVDVYQTKYDLDGNVIEESKRVNGAKYPAMGSKYEIGSSVPEPAAGMTAEELQAQVNAIQTPVVPDPVVPDPVVSVEPAPPVEQTPPIDPGAAV